ncbi:class I SAM-dependent methyltransferase [Nonomuraea sp. NPDC046570]|uniref:class I SAM-dependent methyltransferase n=1 Tax=Nonomuraea sp. NPDC046570 TaxID=3155255 RepID=UPI0033E406CA
MVRADLDKEPTRVSSMFDHVAAGYDRTRSLLWLGRMGAWGGHVAKAADIGPGLRVLDLAAGTGTSSLTLKRPGTEVVACDFSLGMLKVGRSRTRAVTFLAGDAQRLPFADDSFDVATISFGLRNIAVAETALSEMLRVVRPGGRLVVCEYSRPAGPLGQRLWFAYLKYQLPLIARLVSTNPEAYTYLGESIKAWSTPEQLASRISAVGWGSVAWRRLDGGVVALHRAVKPVQGEIAE